MSAKVNPAVMKQFEGMVKLSAQTNMDGNIRTARFRRTIEPQPRPEIKADRINLSDVAKIKDAPKVDVVQNMKKIISEMNNYMHSLNKMLRFDLHEQSGQFVVKMVDYSEGKVVSQIPVDAMLKAHAQFKAIQITDGLFSHKIPWLLVDKVG